MTREIKFRVWDMKAKKYLEDGNGNNEYCVDQDGYAVAINYKPQLHVSIYTLTYVEIEQFTGLKDKNGKEIYENDIVKTTYGNEKVVYYRGHYCPFNLAPYESTTVVGNIHENPELLGEN